MRKPVAIFLLITLFVLAAVAPAIAGRPEQAAPERQDATTYVYWTNLDDGTIMRGDVADGNSAKTCITGQLTVRDIAVVAEVGKVYWLEQGTGRLRRANLNCPATGVQSIGPTLTSPVRLAVDAAGGKVYWTEGETAGNPNNRIRRANLDGSNVETILPGLNNPVGIALDTINGHVYWTDFGADSIWRASLDGTNKQIITQLRQGANPLDIELDPANNRMYWATVRLGAIYSANLDGTNAGVWRSLDQVRSMALDVGAGHLYWAEQGTNQIRRDNLAATNNQLLFNAADGVRQPMGVAVYTDSISNPCFTLSLSHTPTNGGSVPGASPGSSSGCGANSYTAGQSITLTATPAPGWRVAGWTGTNNNGSTSTTNTVTMPSNNHAAGVIYEAVCYTLNRDRDPVAGGSVPVANPAFSTGCGTGQYIAGQTISLQASAATGWHITGWSGTNNDASTANANSVVMPNSNHSVTVLYAEDEPGCFTLGRARVPVAGGSVPSVSPLFSAGCNGGEYRAGELITLSASAAAGWRIAGWVGTSHDATTSSVNNLVMPGNNHTVSVIYEQVAAPCYTLSRERDGDGAVPTASPGSSGGCGANSYTAGQTITLSAAPADGWRVSGWSGTDNDSSTSTINSVVMPAANHAVRVTYAPISGGTEQRVFLPGVLKGMLPAGRCFAGPDETEPNNSGETADGPLCAPGVYFGRPDDERDYFMFETTTAGRIHVTVSDFDPARGMQLSLYYQTATSTAIAFDTTALDGLEVTAPNAQPGRYFIRVFSAAPDPAGTQRYRMQVSYP